MKEAMGLIEWGAEIRMEEDLAKENRSLYNHWVKAWHSLVGELLQISISSGCREMKQYLRRWLIFGKCDDVLLLSRLNYATLSSVIRVLGTVVRVYCASNYLPKLSLGVVAILEGRGQLRILYQLSRLRQVMNRQYPLEQLFLTEKKSKILPHHSLLAVWMK